MDERRSLERAAGPTDSGSQMLMSNSERQWQTSYDLNYKRRESQVAVDGMSAWRDAMLDKSAKKLKTVHTPSPALPAAAPSTASALKKACCVICISSDDDEE